MSGTIELMCLDKIWIFVLYFSYGNDDGLQNYVTNAK